MNIEQKIKRIEQQVQQIAERNQRVEGDKAWELSWIRKALVFVLTYIVVLIVFLIAKIPKPFINALVPAVAFVVSTLTVGLFKKIWLKYSYKKQ